MEIAEPLPPIVIDEPGVLDDNTFVDAGDSLWVATGRRSRVDVRPRRRHRLVQRRRDLPRQRLPSGTRFDPRRGVGQRLLLRRRSSHRCRPRRHGRVVVDAAMTVRRSCASASRPVSSPTTLGRRRTSRSSSTPPARWTSASASVSCSRHSPCSCAACDPTTRSPSSRTATAPFRCSRRPRLPSGRASSTPSTPCEPGGSTNMEAGLLLGYEAARENYDPDGAERRRARLRRRRQPGRHRPAGAHRRDHPGRRRRHPPRHRRLRDGQLQRSPDGAARRPRRRVLLLRRHVPRGRRAVRREPHTDTHRRRRGGQDPGRLRRRRRRPATA